MGYWYEADLSVVRGDDLTITQTWDVNGVATDISSWSFSFEANEVSTRAASPSDITIANAAIVKSDSGSGTTDTNSILLTDTLTTVNVGRYKYDCKVVIGTDEITYARGTLTVLDSQQD